MRSSVAVMATCLILVGIAMADDVAAAIRKPTNIVAQELAPALKRLAGDRNVQLVYRSDLVKDQHTGGAAGDLTFDEALKKLLSGTGLTYRYLESNAVTIEATNGGSPATPPATQSGPAAIDNSLKLEEVVVSAEKRNERLLDVPIPVAVVRSDNLTASNQTRLQDYFTQVPGLTMSDMVGGTPALVIRGITTGGFGNPTVGTTIDDAPVGFSTGTGGGYEAIDLDPSDLQRIEVLRGPQGTLYGASSMGGVLKYVTLDPSTEAVSGRIEDAIEGVQNGRGLGETVRGSVNVPLNQDLAVSASGFARHDEGYIDDPVRKLSGVNDGDAYGARFAMLWRPADDLSIKLNVIHQRGTKDASDDVAAPDLHALQAGVTFIPGSSGYKQHTTFADAVVNWHPGKIDLTSVTAYSSSRDDLLLNLYTLSGLTQTLFGVAGVPYSYDTEGHKFSQELRASIPLGARVTWLLGAFYTREASSTLEHIEAGDFTTGAPVATELTSYYPTTYRETAEFTNLTVNITEQADIQLGARESQIRQHYADVQGGPLASPNTPDTPTSASAFTFLVTPEYKISPDMLAYIRVATGYRAGGPNFNAEQFGLPTTFKPDKTKNYDLGLKGKTLGQMLTYDASLYYIDWNNIQIREITDGFASVANAGGARSEGAELSVALNPLRGLTVSAWAAYDHAILTSALPPQSTAVAYEGDRLPYSSRWSGNLAADQVFPINAALSGFAGASASFVGDRLSDFTPTNNRTVLPSYTKLDMHGGLEFDSWRVNVFANNVTNRRGIVSQAYASPAFHIIKPRTIGIDISARF